MKFLRIRSGLILHILLTLIVSSHLLAFNTQWRKPAWVSTEPTDPKYYHGVGIIEKGSNSTQDYRLAARDMAQTAIASQIKITVTSQTRVKQSESNTGVYEQYDLISEGRVEAVLPEVEQVDTYEDRKVYAIYLRLSKQKYEAQERQLFDATVLEVNQLLSESAKYPFNSVQYLRLKATALNRLTLIPDLIAKYDATGEALTTRATLRSDLSEWVGSILLDHQAEYQWVISKGLVMPIKLHTALKRSNEIKDLPFMPWLVVCDTSKFSVPADTTGSLEIITPLLPELHGQTELKVQPDFVSALGMTTESFRQLINSPIPEYRINILTRGPRILVISDERELDRELDQLYITPILKSALQQQIGIEFVEKKSSTKPEMSIDIRVNSRQSGKPSQVYGNTVYKCLADCEISIKDLETGQEIFTRQAKDISGAAFTDYDAASQQAMKKLSVQVTEKILPDLIRVFHSEVKQHD